LGQNQLDLLEVDKTDCWGDQNQLDST